MQLALAEGIGAALANLGASAALAFIVALAAGIAVLAVLYIGSAVVVLERFARVARRPFWIVVFALGIGLIAALTIQRSSHPELSAQTGQIWWQSFLEIAVSCALGSAIATSASLFLLRRVDPTRLANGVVLVLGLGVFLLLGTFVPLLWLLGILAGMAGAAFWGTRSRRAKNEGSEAGRDAGLSRHPLVHLFVGSSLGALLARIAPEAEMEAVASGGLGLVGLFFGFVLLGLLPLAMAGLLEMRRSVEWFIAIRYLVAKRRQVFISAISAICVGGIAAGVWLIIVVLSVMNGFERTWRDEILGNRAHFTVHSGLGPMEDYEAVVERIRAVDGVIGASPYLDAEGMVRGEGGRISSVRVRGIDPRTVGDVTDLRDDLIRGSLEGLAPAPVAPAGAEEGAAGEGAAGGALPGIVVGNQLALSTGVEVGDPILLISPFGGPQTPLGPAPRLKKFEVVGIFQSSFFQYDEVYTYTSIAAAQDFRRAANVVDGVEARTTDFYRSRRVGAAVRSELGYPYYTRDWKDFFPAFFQALKSERIMMFLLLTMIMVVAAFLIVATLIMMIMEKSSDIAILKAMGAEDSTIERIFAIEGTLIGLAGTLIGVVAGIAVTRQLTWLQRTIEDITGIDTLPASVYQFSTLPTEVDPLQIGLVAAIAMILSLGATLLPSRQGARLDPAEGLRYE